MFPIFFRYLAREIFLVSALVLFALVSLVAFVELVGDLRDMGSASFSWGTAGLYILLSLPQYIMLALPIAALIATLVVVARLSDQSELAVMRTSGLSLTRLSAMVALVGAVFALATAALSEYVVPLAQEAAKITRLQGKGQTVGREFRTGFWLRDGENFINIGSMRANGDLEKVRVYAFGASNKLREITNAAEAVRSAAGIWTLKTVERTRFTADEQVNVERLSELAWQVNFGAGLLQSLKTVPDDMSFTQLYGYIQHLQRNAQQSRNYEVALMNKVVYPVAGIVMMLLALPFAITNARKGGTGVRIVIGIMIGLAFHMFSRLFTYAGQLNNWPAWVSALTPTLVFAALAFASIRWMERR
jgi:lipopolysaccharide export system permease protein